MKLLFKLSIFLSIALVASVHAQVPGAVSIAKRVVSKERAYNVVLNAEHGSPESLILTVDDTSQERIDLRGIGWLPASRRPLKFDVTDERLYLINAIEGGPQAEFHLTGILVADLKAANSSRRFVESYYDKHGVLVTPQLPVPPLDSAVHLARLESGTGSAVFWDIRARNHQDVRLYILSGRRITVWRVPPRDWLATPRVGEPGWLRIASYPADFSEDFVVLNDRNTELVLATSGGDVIEASEKSSRKLIPLDKVKPVLKMAIMDKDAKATILCPDLSVGAKDAQVAVFQSDKVQRKALSEVFSEKTHRGLQQSVNRRK